MKIIYLHQYFKTPEEPGGTRSYWFARKLIEHGHEVVMLTSTDQKLAKGYIRKKVDGIDVIYVENAYSNYMSKMAKIRSFLFFVFKSYKFVKREPDVDLIFATSTPLTIGIIPLLRYFLCKQKYVFEVRDLWPEFPIQIGALKNKLLIYCLKKYEALLYKYAEKIVALSPGMQEGILRTGVYPDKVYMLPNMAKPDLFYPRPVEDRLVREYAIDPNKFNIIHFGSMGVANGLDYIIETALILKQRKVADVNFIFLGDGVTRPALVKKTEAYGLSNVLFLGNYNLSTTSGIVNACDASITSFLDLPVLYTNSPNKLFDSLSAGKPVIVNSAGWTKELVENSNCGFYVDPNDPGDFADKIVLYKNDKERLSSWASNARTLSLTVFDKNIIAGKFLDIINAVNV